ncbi:VCBS repeat-containing protein [Myxococcota bacterium]|nr:VCBS repeat-containing protein [Myxococcota bacterium]
MTAPRSLAPLPVLALLGLACSDYNLHGDPGDGDPDPDDDSFVDDDSTPGPDDDTTPDPIGLCQDEYLPPEAVAVDPTCEPVSVGTFTPVVEWELSAFPVAPSSTAIMMPPAIANLDDDNGDGFVDDHDVPDIVVITYAGGSTQDGVVRAVSGDGVHLWSAQVSAQGQGSVAIGDIDEDGFPEIVLATDTQRPLALNHDGTTLWTGGAASTDVPSVCASPAIGDVDGDGHVEVALGRLVLDGRTGTLLGRGTRGIGGAGTGSTSFFADVDLDGDQELMAGNAAYDKVGATIYTYGSADGYPAVANFDGDDQAEVVVVTNGSVSLYDTTGPRIWGPSNIPGGGGGPPTIADFDGDGAVEVGVASFGAYTVFDGDGSLLWTRPTQDSSSGVTGATVFDFEGDGIAEVVYADEVHLWVFSGPDGVVKLQGMEHSSATWIEYPAIADVDKDGHAEIIYGRNPNFSGSSLGGIAVVGDADDSWMPTRPVWNQHAYSITNIDNDGAVPHYPDPNWLTYNSFRSADLASATGGAAADLFPRAEVCDLDCETFGNAFVVLRVFNEGTADVATPVQVTVYRQEGNTLTYLSGAIVASSIASGWSSEGVRLSFDASVVGDANLVVNVDDDGTGYGSIPECDEDDNLLVIEGPICP